MGAADQWLLAASVKLTALNNANPDGPKAIDFLIKSCDTFAAELTKFVGTDLESLISEGQRLEKAKDGKRRKRRERTEEPIIRTDTFKQLLEQLTSMKDEAEGLIKVTQDIERSLQAKVEEWLELQSKLQSGETYMQVNMPRWWHEYVDQSKPATADLSQHLTSPIRRKMTQQPDTVLEDILDQIKEVEVSIVIFLKSLFAYKQL